MNYIRHSLKAFLFLSSHLILLSLICYDHRRISAKWNYIFFVSISFASIFVFCGHTWVNIFHRHRTHSILWRRPNSKVFFSNRWTFQKCWRYPISNGERMLLLHQYSIIIIKRCSRRRTWLKIVIFVIYDADDACNKQHMYSSHTFFCRIQFSVFACLRAVRVILTNEWGIGKLMQ